MKRMKIIRVILIVVLSVLILGSIKKAVKAIEPYCVYSEAGDDDNRENVSGLAGVGRVTRLLFELGKNQSDVILGRSIYDGYKWTFVNSDGGDSWSDNIILRKKFYEAKDFVVAGGWWYRNASGETKQLICRTNLVVCNREIINFGNTHLQYPATIQTTKTIKGSGVYTCGFIYSTNTSWSGWNSHNPSPELIGYERNGWRWSVRETGNLSWNGTRAGGWRVETGDFNSIVPSAANFPTQLTLDMNAPQFNSGEGDGSYADYGLNGLVVFSRNVPKGDFGSIILPTMRFGIFLPVVPKRPGKFPSPPPPVVLSPWSD